MPKVVIELQANTQAAITQIQRFAKAQADAFDAVKAGSPALQDAFVKVSKLTEGTKGAAGALGEFNQAAKGLAKGGMRDLASEVPLVGSALGQLASTLQGFPLVLGGLVGAGAAVLTWLQKLGTESDAALAKVTALGAGMGAALQQTQLELAKIAATSAGDPGGALEAGAAKRLAAIAAEREAAITAAKAELDQLDLLGRKRTELSMEARNKILAAEADAALKTLEINRQLTADLGKLEDDRVAKETEGREKALQAAAAAAEKQKRLVEDLTASSLATFKGLGAGFEDVVQRLELAQFVTRTQQAIEGLNAGITAGIDTHGRFAAGVAALQAKMAEAVQLGYVPTIQAAEATAVAVTKVGVAAEQAAAQTAAALAAVRSALDSLDARQKVIGTPEGGYGPLTGSPMSGTPTAEYYRARRELDTNAGEAFTARKAEAVLRGASTAGISDPRYPAPVTNNVTINQSGTVIQQDRDWQTLVDTLGQAISAEQR